jgi:hypothetical protein
VIAVAVVAPALIASARSRPLSSSSHTSGAGLGRERFADARGTSGRCSRSWLISPFLSLSDAPPPRLGPARRAAPLAPRPHAVARRRPAQRSFDALALWCQDVRCEGAVAPDATSTQDMADELDAIDSGCGSRQARQQTVTPVSDIRSLVHAGPRPRTRSSVRVRAGASRNAPPNGRVPDQTPL